MGSINYTALHRTWHRLMRTNMYQCSHACFPRKACLVVIIVFSILVTLGIIILDHATTCLMREEELEEIIAVMRTRLKFLESQYRGRQQDILGIQARIDIGCNTSKVNPSDNNASSHSPDLVVLLKNINGSKTSDALLSSKQPEAISAPFSLRIMPHLLDHPDSLRPAYQLRAAKQYADYIIGVPHVKRYRETYLFSTVKFLLDKMTNEDKNYTMIVVMIGETNLTYVVETAHIIETKFPEAVEAGLIEVISPSKHYYPDIDKLPVNLGDSSKRFKWRTKQNLDAIFLMAFAHSRCLYYLMVEDDVLAADNYMNMIRKFTTQTTVSDPDWFFIEYSTTGGIGKLFRSTDLIYFLTYMQLFYYNMPIDWLTESYLADRVCGLEMTVEKCAENKKKIKPSFEKNLFKHIGFYSSLKGKLQKVKALKANIAMEPSLLRIALVTIDGGINVSDYSTKMRLHATKNAIDRIIYKHPHIQSFEFFPHDNPPVSSIKCDLIPYKNHTIEAAYNGECYFWGKNPKSGDVIEFWFQKPGKFERYLVRSGNINHAKDIISKAVFEILPTTHKKNGTFVKIDEFDEFGMVEGQIDSDKYGELLAMRIRFEEIGKFWVLITEIEFIYLMTPANMTLGSIVRS